MKRPSWAKSLRFQLTLWYTAALGVILLAALGLFYRTARATLQGEADQALRAEAARIFARLAPGGEPGEERTDPAALIRQISPSAIALPGADAHSLFLRLEGAGGGTAAVSQNLQGRADLLAALSGPPPHRPTPALTFVGEEEDRMRCLTVRVPQTPYLLQVAAPWDGTEDLLARLLAGIGLAGLLFLAVSGVGSWLLVGRALRPIDRIVTDAERLTADRLTSGLEGGHLSPTLLRPRPPSGNLSGDFSDDEVGHLVVALNGMMTRLSAAFDAQRQFTADASHELRTPLTILQGQFELALARERSPGEYRQALDSGLEEVVRMARIVQSLGFLARGDAGSLPVGITAVRLDALAREAVSALTPRAEEKGLRLVLDDADPAVVRGDPDALRRMLRNLLENAVAYTPPGGRIAVSLEIDVLETGAEGYRLTVADTGVGIAREDLPHIFDRFYRADKARANTGGSGLGLSIAQSVAAAHGGEIQAESELGAGSRFTVLLPRD